MNSRGRDPNVNWRILEREEGSVCVNSPRTLVTSYRVQRFQVTTYERRSLHEMISVLHTRARGMVKPEAIIVKTTKNQ